MRIIESGSNQRPQEKEGILEMLARGLVGGASQSLGQGLGNLATQGLGMLMDPNMKRMDAKTIEGIIGNPRQSQSIADIKNPAFQREMIMGAQKQQADLIAQQRKQQQAQQYTQALNNIMGQGAQQQSTAGEQNQSQLRPEDISELGINDVNNLAKYAQKEKHANAAEKAMGWKTTTDFRKTNKSAYDSANDMDLNIKKMKALDEKGKLDSPEKTTFLKKIGLDWLLEPDSQVFEKIRASFMAGASKAVGGKVSNYELDSYMRRFPSLMNSKEGRQLIYEDMLMMNDLGREAYKIEREIIKENGGNPPMDLEYRVSDRMDNVYKKYQDKIINNIRKSETIGNDSKEVKSGNRVNDLPNPASFVGKKIRDHETGKILVSNGSAWVPQDQENSAKPVNKPSQSIKEVFPLMSGQTNYGEF